MRMRPSTALRLPSGCGDSTRWLRRSEAMAATGAASIIVTDTDSGARARVSDSFHGHDTQAPPNIEIPAAADPRLARAAQHRKTLFGALPEQTRLALLREAMPCELWHASGIEWN